MGHPTFAVHRSLFALPPFCGQVSFNFVASFDKKGYWAQIIYTMGRPYEFIMTKWYA
jgi:hypothetical protein